MHKLGNWLISLVEDDPINLGSHLYTVSQKNWATFIFTVTLSNVGRFS